MQTYWDETHTLSLGILEVVLGLVNGERETKTANIQEGERETLHWVLGFPLAIYVYRYWTIEVCRVCIPTSQMEFWVDFGCRINSL